MHAPFIMAAQDTDPCAGQTATNSEASAVRPSEQATPNSQVSAGRTAPQPTDDCFEEAVSVLASQCGIDASYSLTRYRCTAAESVYVVHDAEQQYVGELRVAPEGARLNRVYKALTAMPASRHIISFRHIAAITVNGTKTIGVWFPPAPNSAAILNASAMSDADAAAVRSATGTIESAALCAMYGALQGLAHAHRNGVAHRNITPDNIRCCGQNIRQSPWALRGFHRSVCDTQHVTSRSRPYVRSTTIMGPQRYHAVELLTTRPTEDRRFINTCATDIWALGIAMHEALTGKAPWPKACPTTCKEYAAYRAAVQGLTPEEAASVKGLWHPDIPHSIARILVLMWTVSSDARPSAVELLRDSVFIHAAKSVRRKLVRTQSSDMLDVAKDMPR